MMHSYHKYMLLLAAALLTACAEKGETTKAGTAIEVASNLASADGTKTPFDLSAPTSEKPLNAAVWLSTTSKEYHGTQTGGNDELATVIDYHNSANFTSGSKQLLSTQIYYPGNNEMVYMVGLYPLSVWSVNGDGNVVDCAFDGSQDLMFAPEVSNDLDHSASHPTLQFGHLLTWLKFTISADNVESSEVWGNIKTVKIRTKDHVTVDLRDNSVAFSESSSDLVMPVRLTSNDAAFENQSIPLANSPEYMAYVLCSPVDATNSDTEYVLTISTRSRQNIRVAVNLLASDGTDFVGNTAGHQFTVNLKFVQGDNILTKAVVSEWQNGGSAVAIVEE